MLDMERVIFVPARIPPHKLEVKISSEQNRLEMVSLAIKNNPFFSVSDIEFNRRGPSFTVETMEAFRRQHPTDELYFIMGMDSLLELETWKDVPRLTSLCRLVVANRPGYELHGEDPRLAHLSDDVWARILIITVPGLDIAARDIRNYLAEGQSVRYLLVPEVEAYIRDHGLYGVKNG